MLCDSSEELEVMIKTLTSGNPRQLAELIEHNCEVDSSRDAHTKKHVRTLLVQSYIKNPLLINKRKFDIRVYGMLVCQYGNLRGYFFEDGYLRTSSKEFTLDNFTNKYIHLTNDAI